MDEARKKIQEEAFDRVLAQGGESLRGHCFNAGCGERLYQSYLERSGVSRITNMDLNLRTISSSSRIKSSDVMADLQSLPFQSGSFDSCLCSEVIEHVPDDRKALKELARVMTEKGNLLMSFPTPPAPEDPAHVREGYALPQIQKLLEEAGFKVLAHRYCFYFFMRTLYSLWQWQYRVPGRGQKSLMPRFVVLAFAWADRLFQIGRPWDLVVLARKKTASGV